MKNLKDFLNTNKVTLPIGAILLVFSVAGQFTTSSAQTLENTRRIEVLEKHQEEYNKAVGEISKHLAYIRGLLQDKENDH